MTLAPSEIEDESPLIYTNVPLLCSTQKNIA